MSARLIIIELSAIGWRIEHRGGPARYLQVEEPGELREVAAHMVPTEARERLNAALAKRLGAAS